MGSTSMMEETTRRRHPSKISSSDSRREIRSGGPSLDEDGQQQRQRGRKKRRSKNRDDPPFLILVVQVGTVLFLLCMVTYHIYRFVSPGHPFTTRTTMSSSSMADDDDDNVDAVNNPVVLTTGAQPQQQQALKLSELLHKDRNGYENDMEQKQDLEDIEESSPIQTPPPTAKPTPPPLPMFKLSAASEWDAFGITKTMLLQKHDNQQPKQQQQQQPSPPSISHPFWDATDAFKREFLQLYGGENAARMLIDQGMTTFRSGGGDVNGDSVGVGESMTTTNTTVMETHPVTKDETMNRPSPSPPHPSHTPPADIVATACRLYHAKQHQRPFRMAFGGYSVTAGRGNRHQDSYPFQLQRLLEPIAQAAGIPVILVHNAAIGGCPSFPYGWCMNQFWGVTTTNNYEDDHGTSTSSWNDTDTVQTPDVVSWDFSMNEATGGPEGLEAYIRQLLATYSSSSSASLADTSQITTTPTTTTTLMNPPPKLIVKDHSTAVHRKQVLAAYAELLHDAVVVHTDAAVQPFLDRDEDFRPPGFQRWREFGAPKGAPGQAYHHPAVQEHELNGWILAMHFVTALEYMMDMEKRAAAATTTTTNKMVDANSWCPSAFQRKDPTERNMVVSSTSSVVLPPPVSGKIMNDTKLRYDSFLFGRPLDTKEVIHKKNTTSNEQKEPQLWVMHPVQCRTTFQPKVSGDLSELVVSGTIAEDLEVTLPKSQYYYNNGWVYDLSESEKKAKRKLDLYPDGLGFRDSKEAYYGIYESPRMTLLLPYETKPGNISDTLAEMPKIGDMATDWFESIIVCQVNEKTLDDHLDTCNFGTDVSFVVGGANVTSNSTEMIDTIGTIYLGKPICKHVGIPAEARLTSHNELLLDDEKPRIALKKDQVGLLVEIFVSNPHIVHIHQACSISHVVWQEQRMKRRDRVDDAEPGGIESMKQ